MFTGVAQRFSKTFHHQDTKAPSEQRAVVHQACFLGLRLFRCASSAGPAPAVHAIDALPAPPFLLFCVENINHLTFHVYLV
jgi:hypothetical protein